MTRTSMVFNSNETINSILNYPEPSFLSVVEIMYNSEVLDVLSSLDYTEPNYNKFAMHYILIISMLSSLSKNILHEIAIIVLIRKP